MVSVLLYGVKMWGWKEHEEIERLHERYIRWTLGLDRCTSWYIVLKEMDREKIKIRTGNRAYKFEEKVLESQGRRIVKACLKEKELGIGGSKVWELREKYFNRNGWSSELMRRQHEKGKKVQQELIERDREVLKQLTESKIRESKYYKKYKWIRVEGTAKYLEKRGERGSQKIITHTRCGNTQDWNKYWDKEETRKCMLCERGRATLKH